jgi:signal transduction histidine kinase
MIERIDAADLIRRASTRALRDPSVKVEFDLPGSCPQVLGWRTLVLHVMENLFANAGEAIHATGRHEGKIVVRTAETSELGQPSLAIRIEDDGDGIAPERLSKIFQRGESTRRHKKGGFGLHWCANTVASFGGRLYATSRGVGKGATFHLVLPIDQLTLSKAA